jgi:hypothetical protein
MCLMNFVSCFYMWQTTRTVHITAGCDVTASGQVDRYRRFGRASSLHLHGSCPEDEDKKFFRNVDKDVPDTPEDDSAAVGEP